MVSKIEVALIGLTIARLTFAIDYQSKIFSQRITHFNNSYVDFGVKYYGDEGYPYLILNEAITPYNDLHVMLYVHVYDQAPNLLSANTPISICKLLHDERLQKNLTLFQFNVPQIYNLEGQSCPIEHKRLRLSPYIFPSKFSTDLDLGCGYMNVESRLLKCDDGLEAEEADRETGTVNRKCETLLKTVTIAFLVKEACKPDQKFNIKDGWII